MKLLLLAALFAFLAVAQASYGYSDYPRYSSYIDGGDSLLGEASSYSRGHDRGDYGGYYDYSHSRGHKLSVAQSQYRPHSGGHFSAYSNADSISYGYRIPQRYRVTYRPRNYDY